MFNVCKKLLSGLICSVLLVSSIGVVWADEQRTEDFSYELTVRSGEGGELVVNYGSESCTVDSENPVVLLVSEGTRVNVSSTPVEGYAVEGISVSDMDGNAVECEESENNVSFEMSGARIVEGSFSMVENDTNDVEEEDTSKSEDDEVSEEEGTVEENTEASESKGNSLSEYSFTKDYFEENLNTKYVDSMEKFQMVNGITTKLSIFDGKYINDTDDLDSIFADWERSGKAYIASTGGVVPIFDVNEDSDYYVGLVDTMFNDNEYTLQDYDFAMDSLNGEVLHDAYLDENGIGYIPKKYFTDKVGKIQVQIMQVAKVSSNEMVSSMVVEVEGSKGARTFRRSIPYTIENGKVFEFKTTVSVEPGLDLSNYVVKVNEVSLGDSDYTYDRENGKLELHMDPSTIATISIEEGTGSEEENPVSTFARFRARAITTNNSLPLIPWNVTGVPSDLYDRLDRGEQPVYVGDVKYEYTTININKLPGYKQFVAWSSSLDSTLKNLAEQIKNGGVDISPVSYSQSDLNYLLYFSQSPNVPGWTWDNMFNVILKCGHISDPFTDTPDTSKPTGRVKVYWRVLGYDIGAGCITVSVLTDRTHTQSGIGVFRVAAPMPKRDVPLDIYKSSANSSITDGNSNYSLAGAVYGIYSNYDCTAEVGRVTTDYTGHARKEGLTPGNYYVKEISASPGYLLDPQVYTINCN